LNTFKIIYMKITDKYDVIGGGAAGISAGIGAAQAGAKTLLVECGPCLGGGLGYCLAFLIIHIGISSLTYYTIEKPCRKYINARWGKETMPVYA
jgi:glycine/D-amino acid oxidase-like deaminating enzyme